MSKKTQSTSHNGRSRQGAAVFVIMGIILLYFLYLMLDFLKTSNYKYMVVREANMESSFSTQGILIREEILVKASSDGVISYEFAGGERVAKGKLLGTLMDNYYGKLLDEKLELVYGRLEEQNPDDEQFAEIEGIMLREIGNYQKTKSAAGYEKLYDLKNTLAKERQNRKELYTLSANQTILSLLAEEDVYLKEKASKTTKLYASASGIVEYSYDGFEGWTYDQLTPSFLTDYNGRYKYLDVRMQTREQGDVLYRLISATNWQLVVFLTDEEAANFSGKSITSFRYNSSEKLSGQILKLEKLPEDQIQGKKTYRMVIQLVSGMQEHDNERLANITFITRSVSGMKISDSCIREEAFYVLPESYLFSMPVGVGLMKESTAPEGAKELRTVVIEPVKQADGLVYFRLPEGLAEGDTVREQGGDATTQILNTVSMKGVYVVNAQTESFRLIEVLYSAGGYSIVSGLKLYDRVEILDR